MLPNSHEDGQINQGPNLNNEFETPAPQNPMPLQNPGNKPVKSKKMLTIIVSLAGVLLLAAGGVGAYLALKDRSDDGADKDAKLSLKDLGDNLRSSIKQPKDVSLLTHAAPYTITMNYKVSDNVWVIPEANSPVLSLSSNREKSQDNKNDYDALIKKLTASGFSEIKTTSNSTYDSKKPTAKYFASKDIVCNLRNTPNDPTYSVQVDCADKADFKANVEAAAPLAKTYKPEQDVIFGNILAQESSTKNYKNARVTVFKLDNLTDGSVASFYQTTDKKWNFFSESKNPDQISCDDYNTDDLKNAFAGFTCLDPATNKSSFVQKAAPTFEIVPGSQG